MCKATTYSLDSWERVVTTAYPDSSTHTFAYDADSNLTSFTDATGTTSRTYDGDSRITSEYKGGSAVVSYGYDATGKKGLLSTITDSNSRTLTRSDDGLKRLTSVAETAGTAYYSYDASTDDRGTGNQVCWCHGEPLSVTAQQCLLSQNLLLDRASACL